MLEESVDKAILIPHLFHAHDPKCFKADGASTLPDTLSVGETVAPREIGNEGALATLHVGKGTIIHKWVRFLRPERIHIGDNCMVADFTLIAGGRGDSITVIGNNCKIHSFVSILGGAGIVLEDHVELSPHVAVFSASHDYHTTDELYGKVVLKHHVLIGAHTIIMPGVTIGEGASIGAMSLVKSDIEPWTVNAGIPTRVLGKRDDPSILS